MTTVDQIARNAAALAARTQLDILAKSPPEILDRTNILLAKWFGFAAQKNRLFFGTVATIEFSGGKWARPRNAESIFQIKGRADTVPNLDGLEVDLVPIDEPTVSPKPLALMGRSFWAIVGSGGPQSGFLDVWFSRAPVPVSVSGALDQPIDDEWPDSQVGLLEVDMALWLAGRDARSEDVPMLTDSLNEWIQLFTSHLEHSEANLVSARMAPRPMLPAGQAAAG